MAHPQCTKKPMRGKQTNNAKGIKVGAVKIGYRRMGGRGKPALTCVAAQVVQLEHTPVVVVVVIVVFVFV